MTVSPLTFTFVVRSKCVTISTRAFVRSDRVAAVTERSVTRIQGAVITLVHVVTGDSVTVEHVARYAGASVVT